MLLAALVALAAPGTLPVTGTLTLPDGTPATGAHALTATLRGDDDALLWTGTQTVLFDAGAFQALLGQDGLLDLASLGDHASLTVTVQLDDGAPSAPVSVGWAARAGYAQRAGVADAVDWSGISGVPTGLADGDQDTRYSASGPGLQLSGTTFSLESSALAPPWATITGRPAGLDDGDQDTLYTPGDGLSLSGGVFAVNAARIQDLADDVCFDDVADFTATTDTRYVRADQSSAINGRLRLGGSSEVCNGTTAGAIRWSGAAFEGCNGTSWQPFMQATQGQSQFAPGTNCAQLKALVPTYTDGTYWIDPDGSGSGAAFQVYCDMTTGGVGWTRVSRLSLQTSGCVVTAAALGDPAGSGACTKYSDTVINQIATEKVFFARVSGVNPTFTRYSGSIVFNGKPGNIIQGISYAAVQSATPNITPGYGGWRFFHQEDWYETDRCKGSQANYSRLSLEYVIDTGSLYYCTQACNAACSAGRGSADVFIR